MKTTVKCSFLAFHYVGSLAVLENISLVNRINYQEARNTFCSDSQQFNMVFVTDLF